MKTAGIDACEAGWLLVSFDDNHKGFEMLREEKELEQTFDSYGRIFLNLPVGLSEEEPMRRCDNQLMDKLGLDPGTEFTPPPVRGVLAAPTYAEANMMCYDLTGSELPVKTWSLVPRIRAVDRLLEDDEARRERVLESDPELILMELNRGRIYQNRLTKKGLKHRLKLIGKEESRTDDIYRTIKEEYRRNEVSEDVIINTLALACAAKKSVEDGVRKLPADPDTDSKGLSMAIHYV